MCEAIKGMKEKAREEERSRIEEKMRRSGMTEKQIKQILNA